MSVRVSYRGGGEGRLVSITADVVVLDSTVPWPPGSRIEGTVGAVGSPAPEGGPGGDAIRLILKVHGSRRQADGSFTVRGRPVDMTRATRDRLLAILGSLLAILLLGWEPSPWGSTSRAHALFNPIHGENERATQASPQQAHRRLQS